MELREAQGRGRCKGRGVEQVGHRGWRGEERGVGRKARGRAEE